jgi:hypothetical protein
MQPVCGGCLLHPPLLFYLLHYLKPPFLLYILGILVSGMSQRAGGFFP